MTDLIENKARQLEHDAKNLEDEDDNLVQAPPSSKETTTAKTTAKNQRTQTMIKLTKQAQVCNTNRDLGHFMVELLTDPHSIAFPTLFSNEF